MRSRELKRVCLAVVSSLALVGCKKDESPPAPGAKAVAAPSAANDKAAAPSAANEAAATMKKAPDSATPAGVRTNVGVEGHAVSIVVPEGAKIMADEEDEKSWFFDRAGAPSIELKLTTEPSFPASVEAGVADLGSWADGLVDKRLEADRFTVVTQIQQPSEPITQSYVIMLHKVSDGAINCTGRANGTLLGDATPVDWAQQAALLTSYCQSLILTP